jgi:UDP-glucose 4-epimerase
MNVLITGATGFIGSHLLRTVEASGLRGRHRFVLLSSRDLDGWDVIRDCRDGEVYRFLATDFKAAGISTIDAVIHLGAYTPKKRADADLIDGAVANIANTRYLLANLPNRPVRFVFASSLDVYAPSTQPISEETPCIPSSLYGLSKLFCEKMLRCWADEAAAGSVSLQVLRIGHIYGAGEDAYEKIIPVTLRKLIAGERPVLFSDGRELRSFLHVSDCCRFILSALERSDEPGPINLASDKAMPLREIVALLCDIHRNVTGQLITPDTQGSPLPTLDFMFDTQKMQSLLGEDSIALADGLLEEYLYFRSKLAV